MISVLLPSRGRVDLLRRSIDSLFRMASRDDNVEVLVGLDSDDEASQEAMLEEDDHRHLVRVVVAAGLDGERFGYHRLHEYFNMLWVHGRGNWFLLWNDDALMQTPGWDHQLDELEPGVAVLHGNHDPFNVFPAVHRAAVEAMGHFSLSNHNDSWLADVAVGVPCLRDTTIQVLHDRFDLTGNNNDATYQQGRGGYRTSEYYGPALSALRGQDVLKVRKALGL